MSQGFSAMTAPANPTPSNPLSQDELKAQVGHAALAYVVKGAIVGVGTGSTVNKFIDALATVKGEIRGAVSSSVASTERLALRWAFRCSTATRWKSWRCTSTAPTRSTTAASW
jgi:DNA-binding transcriptional regulator LsrR (DeoR family)